VAGGDEPQGHARGTIARAKTDRVLGLHMQLIPGELRRAGNAQVHD